MCLYINTDIHHASKEGEYEPRSVRKAIKVYKVLLMSTKTPHLFVTPYQKHPVVFFNYHGESDIAVLSKEDGLQRHLGILFYGGGFHACMTLQAAKLLLKDLLMRPGVLEWQPMVCKCEIPAGAKYFIGGNHDIVSDRMIVYSPFKRYND